MLIKQRVGFYLLDYNKRSRHNREGGVIRQRSTELPVAKQVVKGAVWDGRWRTVLSEGLWEDKGLKRATEVSLTLRRRLGRQASLLVQK